MSFYFVTNAIKWLFKKQNEPQKIKILKCKKLFVQSRKLRAAPKNIKLFLSECGLLIAWKTEKVVGRLN